MSCSSRAFFSSKKPERTEVALPLARDRWNDALSPLSCRLSSFLRSVSRSPCPRGTDFFSPIFHSLKKSRLDCERQKALASMTTAAAALFLFTAKKNFHVAYWIGLDCNGSVVGLDGRMDGCRWQPAWLCH